MHCAIHQLTMQRVLAPLKPLSGLFLYALLFRRPAAGSVGSVYANAQHLVLLPATASTCTHVMQS